MLVTMSRKVRDYQTCPRYSKSAERFKASVRLFRLSAVFLIDLSAQWVVKLRRRGSFGYTRRHVLVTRPLSSVDTFNN